MQASGSMQHEIRKSYGSAANLEIPSAGASAAQIGIALYAAATGRADGRRPCSAPSWSWCSRPPSSSWQCSSLRPSCGAPIRTSPCPTWRSG